MKSAHPYQNLAPQAFWRSAVASRHVSQLENLWKPIALSRSDRIATAGSCFAQHLGHALRDRGAHWMDLEPAPPLFATPAEARRWGYGIFSCRYGNVYTTRQLVQLFDEAQGLRCPAEQIWERGGRYFDALRPGIDPVGHEKPETVLAQRAIHLAAVRKMFAAVDVMVFTLGLTEAWELIEDGTLFPSAPGVLAGAYDPKRYRLRRLSYADVRADLLGFRERLLRVNPAARMLLTVSPVPLAATATSDHVLVASTAAKAVLRAVAGELADELSDVTYFPSFEIISAHTTRGMFYEPDQRNVAPPGIQQVMDTFFSGPLAVEFGQSGSSQSMNFPDVVCDEAALDPP